MATFGILHDFRQPLPHTVDYADYYAECLAEVAEAERLGFRTVWLSEHHLTPDGMPPSPLVLAAAIAARTTRIEIGTSVLVLPLHHPLRVAEDAALVDLLSGGRLVLGVGQGYAEREFAAFGVDRRRRGALLEESVATLRDWSHAGAPVTPSPKRTVPLYVGGVTEQGLRRAVRLGDGVIIYCGTPADLLARRALLDTIDESTPLIATSILHVAEDADEAWERAAPGIAYLEGQIAAYAEREPGSLRREDYLVGTPEEVAARLAELRDRLRFVHFAHWARLPGMSHACALESLRLVAERVLPVVLGS
jgi:alkanesulfonate monooxygenase SsuD/methylene tetrahydromethanopterin reductase-like flavin-dependent oxidoreductase (luciferase family)